MHWLEPVILALTVEKLRQEEWQAFKVSLVYMVSKHTERETQVLRVLYQPREGKWWEYDCVVPLHSPKVEQPPSTVD